MYCSKCGNDLGETANFCSKCGTFIKNAKVDPIQQGQQEQKNLKNKTVPWLMLFVVLQFGLLIIATSLGESDNAVWFFAGSALFIPVVLVLSIMCIKKSKKIEKHKGKAIGVLFTIISLINIVIIGSALLSVVYEPKGIEKGVRTAKNHAVNSLESSLKNPSSMEINKIKAEIRSKDNAHLEIKDIESSDEAFEGYIFIYIDISAMNGFGGFNRQCYAFKYKYYGDGYVSYIEDYEVSSIPKKASIDL